MASREMTVGSDTDNYIALFEKCSMYKWEILNMNLHFEKGFLIFNVLLSYLHISPRVFLCIMSFIFSYAAYKFIDDNSDNPLMSVLLFINLMFLYESMNTMRQFLALSTVLLFGFNYVKNKKPLKYIMIVLLASLFHVTALAALFIYPIYHLKYSKKIVFVIVLASILGLIFLSWIYPLLSTLLGREAYYINMIGELKLGNLVSTLIFLSMYVFSLIILSGKDLKKYSFYLYSLLFATALCFVSINMAVLSRVSQYYTIFSIIALPNIINANIGKSKAMIEFVIIGLFMTYSSVIMINKPEWNSAYDYKTCLIPEEGYICE
ncbi:EpsG family protein [Candidatus Saccharibacteria bacterium]|nr:EpsG family protein [Candidatus Saccharibacteria bacterium]